MFDKLLIVKNIGTAASEGFDNAAFMGISHSLLISPDNLGTADGDVRIVAVKRIFFHLLSCCAENCVRRAEAELLESAAAVPQLCNHGFGSCFKIAHDVRRFIHEHIFCIGNVLDKGFTAVSEILTGCKGVSQEVTVDIKIIVDI